MMRVVDIAPAPVHITPSADFLAQDGVVSCVGNAKRTVCLDTRTHVTAGKKRSKRKPRAFGKRRARKQRRTVQPKGVSASARHFHDEGRSSRPVVCSSTGEKDLAEQVRRPPQNLARSGITLGCEG